MSVEITQLMRVDLVENYPANDVVECEGRYAATLAKVADGWKVLTFRVESVVPMPEAPAFVLTPHGYRARWPCVRILP